MKYHKPVCQSGAKVGDVQLSDCFVYLKLKTGFVYVRKNEGDILFCIGSVWKTCLQTNEIQTVRKVVS